MENIVAFILSKTNSCFSVTVSQPAEFVSEKKKMALSKNHVVGLLFFVRHFQPHGSCFCAAIADPFVFATFPPYDCFTSSVNEKPKLMDDQLY